MGYNEVIWKGRVMTTYFHITPTTNLDSILKNGLVPAIGPRSKLIKETEPAIYLFTSVASAEDALSSWLGENLPKDPVTLLRLSNVKIDESWNIASSLAGYEKVSTEIIYPKNIEVIDRNF